MHSHIQQPSDVTAKEAAILWGADELSGKQRKMMSKIRDLSLKSGNPYFATPSQPNRVEIVM